jgi:cytochrome c-type biogenesis protein
MIEGAFALAFAAGMVATFNPCGFAMLPAYLAYFLGMEDESPDTGTAVIRALKVSAMLTMGFVLVFGFAGWLLSWTTGVQEKLPWITIIIGMGLIALGIAFLRGFELTVGLPKLNKGTGSRQLGSMFLFGVSYAVASLSCTIGPFLAVTGVFGAGRSTVSGVALFVMYGLGMGLVLGVLTLAVALARQGLVAKMRGILPYVNKISGVLLILAGLYMAWYGYWETRIFNGDTTSGGPAEFFFTLNSDLSNWVSDVGATNIGLVLGAIVAVVVVLTVGWRAMNKPQDMGGPGTEPTTEPAARTVPAEPAIGTSTERDSSPV